MAYLSVGVYDVSIADKLDALILNVRILLSQVLHYRP